MDNTMKKAMIMAGVLGASACMLLTGCGVNYTSTTTETVTNSDGSVTTTTKTNDNGKKSVETVTTSASELAAEKEDTSVEYELTVANETDFDFCEFYMTNEPEDWGDNMVEGLEGSVLRSGEQVSGTFRTDEEKTDWDVKIVDEDGNEYIITEVDMSGDGRAQVLTFSGENGDYAYEIVYAE